MAFARTALAFEGSALALTDFDVLRASARAMNPRALAELGARLVTGRAAPRAPEQGMILLEEAAAQNSGMALHFLAMLAARRNDWKTAWEFSEKAAATGHQRAHAQVKLLGPREHFDVASWLRPPALAMQFEAPRLGVIKNFLPRSFCSWMIDAARDRLSRVQVLDRETGRAETTAGRSNTAVGFGFTNSDLIVQLIDARIAAAVGSPVRNGEPTNVLHYSLGEEFGFHYDFFEGPSFASEITDYGQRATTVLIYLNDDYEGAETDFPLLNWRFKGGTGDALVFWNVSPHGRLEHKSMHAGLPPTRGEKWLLSKWLRDKEHPLL